MEYGPLGLQLQVEVLLGKRVHQNASACDLNVMIGQVQCNDWVGINGIKSMFGLPFFPLFDCQTSFRLLFSGPSQIDLREGFKNLFDIFFTFSELG